MVKRNGASRESRRLVFGVFWSRFLQRRGGVFLKIIKM